MRDRREIRGTGVSNARRRAVMAAYNYTCVTCGLIGYEKRWPDNHSSFPTDEPGNALSIDHVHPWSNDDLAVLCQRCNSQKGDRPPVFDLVRATLLDPTVHLQPVGDYPTLCYAPVACRVGGWPAPRVPKRYRRDEPRPARVCRLCWIAAATTDPGTTSNHRKSAYTPTADSRAS